MVSCPPDSTYLPGDSENPRSCYDFNLKCSTQVHALFPSWWHCWEAVESLEGGVPVEVGNLGWVFKPWPLVPGVPWCKQPASRVSTATNWTGLPCLAHQDGLSSGRPWDRINLSSLELFLSGITITMIQKSIQKGLEYNAASEVLVRHEWGPGFNPQCGQTGCSYNPSTRT